MKQKHFFYFTKIKIYHPYHIKINKQNFLKHLLFIAFFYPNVQKVNLYIHKPNYQSNCEVQDKVGTVLTKHTHKHTLNYSITESIKMGRSICIAFILLVLISATPLISSTNPSVLSKKEAKNDDKVVIALYYETLCPYCSNLIVNYLYKYFEDGLDSISILKLVPYGNAKIRPNNTIVCQVYYLVILIIVVLDLANRSSILYYLFVGIFYFLVLIFRLINIRLPVMYSYQCIILDEIFGLY